MDIYVGGLVSGGVVSYFLDEADAYSFATWLGEQEDEDTFVGGTPGVGRNRGEFYTCTCVLDGKTTIVVVPQQ